MPLRPSTTLPAPSARAACRAQKGQAAWLLLALFRGCAESKKSQTEAAQIQSSATSLTGVCSPEAMGLVPRPDAPLSAAPPEKAWPGQSYLLLFKPRPLTMPMCANGARAR